MDSERKTQEQCIALFESDNEMRILESERKTQEQIIELLDRDDEISLSSILESERKKQDHIIDMLDSDDEVSIMDSRRKTQEQIRAELDSDDELPDSYIDIGELPAYQNDYRFNPIRFPWVETFCREHCNTPQKEPENDYNLPELPYQYDYNLPEQSMDYTRPCSGEQSFINDNHLPEQVHVSDPKSEKPQKGQKIILSEGYLKRCDFYIMKSMENLVSENLMLWFLEYTKAKYMSPPGCLVQDYITYTDFNNTNTSISDSKSECESPKNYITKLRVVRDF